MTDELIDELNGKIQFLESELNYQRGLARFSGEIERAIKRDHPWGIIVGLRDVFFNPMPDAKQTRAYENLKSALDWFVDNNEKALQDQQPKGEGE